MRPLELSLEGFTSFRHAECVDFSTLDLFAITGPTGAGKSSLLDAITFALYGTTLRTGKQASELLSQGSTDLKVQFRFSVRGVEHRMTRTWRQRPKSTESKALLERLEDGVWQTFSSSATAAQKAVEDILGMDFDTFTRVIVLPQGQFDQFLKGDAPKRRELLRQLGGLEVYEAMRKMASERARQLRGDREALENQMAGLQIPPPEEVAGVAAELVALDARLPALQDAFDGARKALEAEERLVAEIERLKALQQGLAAEVGRGEEMALLRERIERARVAERLQGDWSRLMESRGHLDKARQEGDRLADLHRQAQQALSCEQSRLDAALSHQDALSPQFKEREAAITLAASVTAQRVQAAQETAQSARALAEKSARWEKAQAELGQAQAALKAAEFARQEAEKAQGEHPAGGDRLIALNEAAPLITQWGLLNKQVETLKGQLARLEEDKQAAEAQVAQAQAGLQAAEQAFLEARAAREAAQADNQNALLQGHVHALRAVLKPDDACPVCLHQYPGMGALPPLEPVPTTNLAPYEAAEAGADGRVRTAQTALVRAEAAMDELNRRSAEDRKAMETAEQERAEAGGPLEELLKSTNWDARALLLERRALNASDVLHREAQEKLKAACAEQEQALVAGRFAAEALDNAARDHAEARAEAERRSEHLGRIEARLAELTNGQSVESLSRALEAERQALEQETASALEAFQKAHTAAIQAEEAAKQGREGAHQAEMSRARAEAAWREALLKARMDEAAYLGAQADEALQASWAETLAGHGHELVRLRTLVAELEGQIGDRQSDESQLTQKRDQVAGAQGALAGARTQSADWKAWLQVVESKRQAAGALGEQLESVAGREQTYQTLARDLKADEFQSYLLEHLQADLVLRATVILKELSDERYALKLYEGEFWVEDNWNAGETRRVRTLSGGETFAASLSMALALSEKLAMGAELGCLFLDEGFGTLDAETLEAVSQVLESLRRKNRLIGVITHVKALGERLPTQLRVHKAPEGSRVLVETL